MKKLFALLFTFFIGFHAHAQRDSLKVVNSEIFKDEKFKTSLLYAKEDKNGDIFTVRNYYSSLSNPKGYYIEHYDKALNLLKRTTVEIDRNEIKGFYLNDDSIVLLQFQYLQKEKKYAFVTLTSAKDEFNFTEKLIYEIDRNRIYKYDHFGIRSEPEFNIHRQNNLGDIVESENEEFIGINLITKTKESDALLTIVFNRKFEKLYEHEFRPEISINEKVPSFELPLEYQNMVLDNNGTTYILARVFKNKSTDLSKKDEPNYNFIVFKGDINAQSQEIIPIESNNIIRALQLVNKGEKLAAIGFYTETADVPLITLSYGDRFDGVVRFNLDKKSLSTLSESFQPFSEEFMIEKYGKVKDKVKSFLSYRSLFMIDNGDVIVNAEEFYIIIDDRGLRANKIYKDIITCRIDDAGQLTWAKNINKSQSAYSTDKIPYFSYTATVKNNVSYYLVNSTSSLKYKNQQIQLEEGPLLYVLKIFENGDFQYTKPNFESIYNAQLQVRFGVLINKTDILLEAESDNKSLMVKLYFD